ncbi:hypothetical protein QZH41_005080 [Actinostola sp. cb2023]|nr:hypothetical protein QZH41_005080 [Actinostola sp. cb2023]
MASSSSRSRGGRECINISDEVGLKRRLKEDVVPTVDTAGSLALQGLAKAGEISQRERRKVPEKAAVDQPINRPVNEEEEPYSSNTDENEESGDDTDWSQMEEDSTEPEDDHEALIDHCSQNTVKIESDTSPLDEPKFIVFHSMLITIFSMFCFLCKSANPSVNVTRNDYVQDLKKVLLEKMTDAEATFKDYKELVPEPLNHQFPQRLEKSLAIESVLERKVPILLFPPVMPPRKRQRTRTSDAVEVDPSQAQVPPAVNGGSATGPSIDASALADTICSAVRSALANHQQRETPGQKQSVTNILL